MPRLYTPAEANLALDEVRGFVERIVHFLPLLPELEEAVRLAEFKASREGSGPAAARVLDEAQEALRAAEMAVSVGIQSLEAMDVNLKDAGTGLVDLLCNRDGQVVELCWRLGEPVVGYWHHVGEGFAGRKPL